VSANQMRISSEFAGDLLSGSDAERTNQLSILSWKCTTRGGGFQPPARFKLSSSRWPCLKDGTRAAENFGNLNGAALRATEAPCSHLAVKSESVSGHHNDGGEA